MKKGMKILIGLGLTVLVAYVGSMITESMLGTFVSLNELLIMVGVAIVAVIILVVAAKMPKFWAGAIVIGVIISPYFQFLFGKVNIFMTDPPQLRPSVTVPEIRVEMGDLFFINSEGQEINVLPASGVKTLYPGKNTVNLGQLNIPAGTYKSGKMSMKSIEVDVIVDLAKEAELGYAKFAQEFKPDIPADIPPEALQNIPTEADIKARVMEGMKQYINAKVIGAYLPPFVKIKTFENDGVKIKMVLSAQIELPPLPIAFPYPTGTGGPDIVLDITLNEIGLPVGIVPIIKLPPGAPAIDIPDMTPKLGNINIPTDFGMPQEVFARVKAEISAGVQKGEEMKKELQNKK